MATEDRNTTAAATASSTPAGTSATLPSARVDRAPVHAGVEAEAASGGRTIIADGVVAKVAGIAAREVPGVYRLGGNGGGARAMGAIRDAMNVDDFGQGVKVEVGETQAAADITIIVEYPMPIQQVAEGVRTAVSTAIATLVGLEVVEVNIAVTDVHLPEERTETETVRVS